jgi:hypothetical protein
VVEQLHERVHADVGVGEFSGEGYLYLFLRKRWLFRVSRFLSGEARVGV